MKHYKCLLLCIFMLSCAVSEAQNNFYGLLKPSLGLKVSTDGPWSFSFGMANRSIVYQQKEFKSHQDFTSLSGFAGYALGKGHKISLGYRHRFYTIYDSHATDEDRIMQQYNYSHPTKGLTYLYRVRFEERLKAQDQLRSRFLFGVKFPLGKTDSLSKPWYLTTETEVLLSVWSGIRPTYQQYTTAMLSKSLSEHTRFKVGLQYRLNDYTHQAVHKLFLLIGLGVSI